jgi:hydrophobe/amphiphile efflux-1 (HAE1) family protein
MKLRIFIDRPILASVISLIIVLCGIAAAFNLPVEQYPNISPPSIVVSATYPGASAETIEKSIAAQFENKLNGIEGVIYMASTSTGSGSVSVRLTFAVGTNLNYAVNEVLNRVHAAMPLLPSIVQQLGVTVRRSSPDMLMVLGFYNQGNGKFNQYYLSNYINRTVYNDLSLVPGVGQVSVYGTTYAIRVWLNVNKMNSLNISPNDIATAIKDQSNEYVVGRTNASPMESAVLTFNVSGGHMYSTPKQFENIILRESGTQIIRISDVANVELGGNSYSVIPTTHFYENGKLDEKLVVGMQIFMDPSGNQLEVKKKVLQRLEQDAHNFPPGIGYHVIFDATQFVSASIENVGHALRDALILVGLVILLFLQNWRASIIALATIPVSVMGSFACLYILGFSINTLTLFALILAIGIVVDDAIVVVENIERLKVTYPKLTIKQIVELAMHEVFGAIIAIGLVLSVVFLPVMGLGGLSGVLYRQFAVTIACTVIISALTALTLTPAISALLLKRHIELSKFGRKFNQGLDKLTNWYLYFAEKLIDWRKYILISVIAVIGVVVIIYKLIPLSFVPNEDQGYFIAAIDLPTSASLDNTYEMAQKISSQLIHKPGVGEVIQLVGLDFLNSGVNSYAAAIVVRLKNWDERTSPGEDVQSLVNFANSLNGKYKNVMIRAFNQPPIRGLSTTGGVEFYLEDRTVGDLMALGKVAGELDKKLMAHKEIKLAYHLLDTNVEQVLVLPDVAAAKNYHVNITNIYNTLQSIYSNNNVNFAFLMQGLVWVILQADYKFRKGVNNLSNVYIKNNLNKLVPVNSLVKVSYFKSPQVVERFNDYLATKEIVEPSLGFSSGDVMNIIQNEIQTLPRGYDYDWFGSSFQQKQSQKTSTMAFAFSLVMIYLVLCALYEMWRLPLVVLMGAPFALLGSGIMLLLRHQPNDLYFQISLITLLGLSAKNIILLIEFALQYFNAGHSAKDSALHALKLRFRPILMTSITFIMGALPLVFATGAGANAEHSVGTGIIGGMLGSVILGTLFTPSYFVVIMQNYKKKKE